MPYFNAYSQTEGLPHTFRVLPSGFVDLFA